MTRHPETIVAVDASDLFLDRLSGVVDPEASAVTAVSLEHTEVLGDTLEYRTLKRRLRERGYNQAEVLATAYADRSRRSVLCALERASAGTSQTNLQPAARLANVATAFRIVEGGHADVAGAHLLLVDDEAIVDRVGR